MQQQIIQTNEAPKAVGPYVQARKVGPMLYTSGQIALHPDTGEMVGSDVETQTKQALNNLLAVVRAAGGDRENIVKNTVFLKDMDHFGTVNAIYEEFFGEHKPARSCVEVARLPKDALVEIESVALIPE